MKFGDTGNEKILLELIATLLIRSSSSKLIFDAFQKSSRRDMQTVEFGIIQTLTIVSAYPRQVVGLHIKPR